MRPRTFSISLAALGLASLAVRAGYVIAQRSSDPAFASPTLDAALYVDWARGLASGAAGQPGAYYLAPLYPFFLAGIFRLVGESFATLYLIQHAAVVAAAILLGLVARRAAGERAALATAAIALLYHPLVFFASRPMGESVAILAVAAALYLSERSPLGAGVASGLAALARPNLLLVPLAWGVGLVRARRWKPALLVGAGVMLALAPVVARNGAASGTLVGISTNGGLTLYHGNGPGARGVFTPPEGFSGDPNLQRAEATALARQRSGLPLDPVAADRWWGRQALRTRLADPLGTVRLVATRLALLLDHYEHGLDYAPRLDENPWRHAAPLGFSALLALAAVGVGRAGFRGTGGWPVWGAIGAAAATPLVFYMSSRYRLPLAALLAVPAGIGAAGLDRLTWRSGTAGLALAALSLSIPSGALARSEEAVALANRAIEYQRLGDLGAAERDARAAVARDSTSPAAQYNLGVVLEAAGRAPEAEAAYRRALTYDPGQAEAAGNLARILILRGGAAEAVPILRRALAARPGHAVCWTNLVLAFAATGDATAARQTLREAVRAGVELDPGVVEAIGEPHEER